MKVAEVCPFTAETRRPSQPRGIRRRAVNENANTPAAISSIPDEGSGIAVLTTDTSSKFQSAKRFVPWKLSKVLEPVISEPGTRNDSEVYGNAVSPDTVTEKDPKAAVKESKGNPDSSNNEKVRL